MCYHRMSFWEWKKKEKLEFLWWIETENILWIPIIQIWNFRIKYSFINCTYRIEKKNWNQWSSIDLVSSFISIPWYICYDSYCHCIATIIKNILILIKNFKHLSLIYTVNTILLVQTEKHTQNLNEKHNPQEFI